MKKFLVCFTAACLAVGAFAQDANLMKYVQLIPPTVTTNTTTTGSTFDLSAYKGNGIFLVAVGTASATNQMTTVTFQHSTNSAFATVSTVTNINGVAGVLANAVGETTTNGVGLATFACDTARLHKYVRAVSVQSLADQSAPVSVMFVAPMKSE